MQEDETTTSPNQARANLQLRDGQLVCTGAWTSLRLFPLRTRLRRLRAGAERISLDTSGVGLMDTAGGYYLNRILAELERGGATVDTSLVPERHKQLMALAARHAKPPPEQSRTLNFIATVGEVTVHELRLLLGFLSFVGDVAARSLPSLLMPHRLRWKQIIAEMELAGARAVPILALLSFLTGVVIAYQGGTPLEDFGATIFMVELVAITILREMGPLMTAIIVAGRTGSSYTAQIATMRITEEIDALRSLGVGPYEMLVLPKVIGLVLVLPLLTILANAMGLLGGLVVATTFFDIPAADFLQRVPEQVASSNLWVGIIKAPIFAATIALIACYQGFAARGGTASVGHATTRSVVQGIFLVIVLDAIFAVIFTQVGI
ncbi:phospholipid/cholesterol/gamma-HCH transport system permease protein [Natronocella acetinitrilica]|uniref:Phospholipid/cholesterol/gamma-HCH transport system permease protein n=1 Tax=Natronocella acetinitrilica TaxID=414046 RepID=A0AAE3G694_9GAMM|nr:phospholipid/cholesterol/gamma-HCH transport system permease protein [Natronocella acetinitrilica]